MKGLMTRVLLVAGILLAMPALAQTWEPVIGADKLRAVFSDTEMEAALEGGQKMTALYRSDGTGEVTAWGDTFERQWRIDGNELICIKMSSRYESFRLEKNADKDNEYRGTNVATRETVIFTVTAGVAQAQKLKPTTAGGAGAPSAEEMAPSFPTRPRRL